MQPHSALPAQGALPRNQRLVLDALRKVRGPRTAYELLENLRDQGFRAPLTVYRALRLRRRFRHRPRISLPAGKGPRMKSPQTPAPASILRLGGAERLAIAAGASAVLWLAVWWAIG